MKSAGPLAGWGVGVLTVVATLVPQRTLACPVCFASTSERLLQSYYLSAAFLTLMPFLVLGAVGGWLLRRRRRGATRYGDWSAGAHDAEVS